MPPSTVKRVTINEVSVEVPFSHLVTCEIDVVRRQLTIGRMEIHNKGAQAIPAGWRGKIYLISGINRLVPIRDAIPLPAMGPGITPLGPLEADEIPNDLLSSKDEWSAEFRIVDLDQNEQPLLRNKIRRRDQTDTERQLNDEKNRLERLAGEHEERIKGYNQQLVDSMQREKDLQRNVDALLAQVGTLKQALVDNQSRIEEVQRDLAHRNEHYNEAAKQNTRLSEERADLERDKHRANEQIEELLQSQAALQTEQRKLRDELTEQRKQVDQLKNERDRAKRMAEDLGHKVVTLQEQLASGEMLYVQLGNRLDEEISKSSALDQQLTISRENVEQQDRVIRQHESAIAKLTSEHQQAQAELSHLRDTRDQLTTNLATKERLVDALRSELERSQSGLKSAQAELDRAQAQIEQVSVGKTLFERYEVIRQVENRDTGEVYKVYDKKLGRAVALRVLPVLLTSDRRALDQLRQEAQQLSKLSHANNVRLYDFVEGEALYFTTEFVEGRTFRQMIDTEAPLSLELAIDYIQQICKGLNSAHRQGVYHRNLNPDHLMLADSGFVKVVDYGMADVIRSTITRVTGIINPHALRYMAPEQLRSEREIDGRTDIYSLGIVFYELLSGQPPFTGENTTEQSLNEEPRIIVHVPTDINMVVRRCLEKSPAARYQKAEELHQVLVDLGYTR